MQTLTLHIDGMTCGGCVKSATNALLAVNGVIDAKVSLENKNAEIRFDSSKTDAAALLEAVEDAGYDASL
ncbi:heavy-metal-associated domain-containing protein [Uruburuella suis]|uniref:Copper chaperone n=1 Tax=Uruburuella suis TaxID=252130 RepID=A0AAE9GZ01_9NEIS|nr:heavy-metal-associated domain-containing protein [Uruburuella suis]TCP10167.1 copper chaperone [Uruburuella suis]UOO80455.1 heavy-metal-associated domain-containing protein [Uruburuella suis]